MAPQMSKEQTQAESIKVKAPAQAAGAEEAATKVAEEKKNKQKTVVIKVGTSSLLRKGHLHLSLLGTLAETCADLTRSGIKVIVVTSGAIGAGCQVLGTTEKPTDLAGKQAMAAVGMVRLMRMYDDFFTSVSQPIAQVLVSLDNLMERQQYLNAQRTFQALLARDVIPIVNENDTVAVQDTKFGDNDTLSAHIAALADADYLFLLTDVDGLYTGNPSTDPDAVIIPLVENIEDLDVDTKAAGSKWGTGGMATKIEAARMATASGCHTVVMHSNQLSVLHDVVVNGASYGTLFLAVPRPLGGRKRWILLIPANGDIVVNKRAETALNNDKNLSGFHIVSVTGEFAADECVRLLVQEEDGGEPREFGRAIVNYASKDCQKLSGTQNANEFFDIVGYSGPESVAHRNNICLWMPHGEEPNLDLHPEIDMATHPSAANLEDLDDMRVSTRSPALNGSGGSGNGNGSSKAH